MALSKPIILLGEAFGANEVKIGRGFVGAGGIELLRMLNDANVFELTSTDRDYINKFYRTGDPNAIDMVWQLHPEFYRTNVFQLHPPGNALESLCGTKAEAIPGYPKITSKSPGYVRAEFEPQLERLGDEILTIDPNLIVCLGNAALWALAGRTGISKLRGTTCLSDHIVRDYKLLCTYHPAAVMRQWELRPTTVIDLAKIPLEASFPEVRRPNCTIWIEPSLPDIERFINEHILSCEILATDIETSGTRITCIGFAPRRDLAIVIPFDDERKPKGNYWPTPELEHNAWALIRGVLEDPSIRKSFQNGLFDIAFLLRSYGIKTLGATEDSMLLHHALQPESLKGLGFLGSVYTNHGPWKSERHSATTIKRDA